MIKTDKLIICVCPTGSWLMKDFNPNVPIQPNEVAEEVYRSWKEGASMVHIHARDKDGHATSNPDVFREIDRRIREKGCDIILQHSVSPGRGPGQVMKSELKDVPENLLFAAVDKGLETLEPNPEMGSLDIGISVLAGPPERIFLWTRAFVEKAAKTMLEKGIKPEPEVYTVGGMVEVHDLIRKGLLPKPYWIGFCVGMERTVEDVTPFTPKNLIHLVDQLPEGSLFSTLGIGPVETLAVTQSILLGGHVRVGFEDNPYYSKGVLAKSNAELVARVARIGRDLGREIASPDEARELLGIPKLKQ
jgi:3-keto-5-aminohexanoate cleavage enzyme